MTETALARIEQAVRLLAEARDLDEVTHIHAMAQAAAEYARAERLGNEAIGYAREIQVRAARKGGEILVAMAQDGERVGPGRPPKSSTMARVSDIGITYAKSSRWRKLAEVPAEQFESLIAAGASESMIADPRHNERERTRRVRSVVPAPPAREILDERGKRSATMKQSLRGLQHASVQIQSLAEALDGHLLGDWTQLYSVAEAQPYFDVVEASLQVVTARLRRVLREREAGRGTEGTSTVSHGAFGGASH